MKYIIGLIIFFFGGISAQSSKINPGKLISETIISDSMEIVQSGLENFLQNYVHLVQNKRVGLVTNPSGVDRNFNSTVDIFYQHPLIKLTTLFGVEHGIRGEISGGQKIPDFKDAITGLPVYSLYGSVKKPTAEMLQSVDVIIFDIQDVGVRGYTYISSLGMIIEAAAENNVQVIILDRPNPLGGVAVEGNILKKEYQSFVGYFEIPYRHAMTIGEIALMHNSQNKLDAKLTVIPLLNWQRSMFWDETKLPWIPTSPHVQHWHTTLFLPLTGIIGELHTVNIGVGYTAPFEYIGAPWINAHLLADSLNSLKLAGLHFSPAHYKPYYSSYKGEICHGVQIHITNKEIYRPFIAGLHILKTLMDLYPKQDLYSKNGRINTFNRVLGSSDVYGGLTTGKSVIQMQNQWQQDFDDFLIIRKKYLLY